MSVSATLDLPPTVLPLSELHEVGKGFPVRSAGEARSRPKAYAMRRFVKDRVAAALERTRPSFEDYVSRYLEYPLGFPYKFAPAAVLVREFRLLKVAP
jgi:hypothetical protein